MRSRSRPASSQIQITLGSVDHCTGKPYAFNPHAAAQLILAESDSATTGISVSKTISVECGQRLPARNHHCVLVIPWTRYEVDASQLACNPSCHLNLVMSSWGEGAKPGNKLVVGGDSHGPIKQDKGRINLVHFPDASARLPKPLESTKARVNTLKIGPDLGDVDKDPPQTSIFSVRIANPRIGDQFMVEARVVTKIGSVDYTVEIPVQVIVAKRPGTTDAAGVAVYTDPSSDVSEFNGVNCTQKPSDWSNPCVRDKNGVVRIAKDRSELYINVTESAEAKLTDEDWDPGDRVKIVGGYLRVWRLE